MVAGSNKEAAIVALNEGKIGDFLLMCVTRLGPDRVQVDKDVIAVYREKCLEVERTARYPDDCVIIKGNPMLEMDSWMEMPLDERKKRRVGLSPFPPQADRLLLAIWASGITGDTNNRGEMRPPRQDVILHYLHPQKNEIPASATRLVMSRIDAGYLAKGLEQTFIP